MAIGSQRQATSTQALRVARNRDVITNMKLANGCAKCGYNHCAAALHYHHRNPKLKTANVGRMVSKGMALKNVLAEVKKCELLCANCHAERESSRLQTN